jgi:hypothetical protein
MMVHVMMAAKHDASAYFLFVSAVNDRIRIGTFAWRQCLTVEG